MEDYDEEPVLSEPDEDDLDPRVLSRIEKISDILNQTNLNLNMFERLLPAYRSDEPPSAKDPARSRLEQEIAELRAINGDLSGRLVSLDSRCRELEHRLVLTEAKRDGYALENTSVLLINDDLRTNISELKKLLECKEKEICSFASYKTVENEAPSISHIKEQGGEGNSNLITQPEYTSLQERIRSLKESRDKIKKKTRELLRHYRNKRNLLEKRERQLLSHKSGLLKLQTLHQNLQSSHIIIIDHLGAELKVVSSLASLLCPDEMEEPPPDLSPCTRGSLSSWYTQVETLINWTKHQLISLALKSSDSSPSDQVILFRRLKRTTSEKRRQDDTLASDSGAKPLTSISENVSVCSVNQESTLRTMINDIEL